MAQSALVRIERVVDFLAYHPTSGIIRSFPTSGIIRKTRIKQSANRLSSPRIGNVVVPKKTIV